MFTTPITTTDLFNAHAKLPYPFLEEGESYLTPTLTPRNQLITRTINELRSVLSPLRSKLLPFMAVKATVTDITDLVNCGLCHTFAALVRGQLELMGVDLILLGDPFHVWLCDPVEGIHYDAHFTMGTRYREDIDGGYSLSRDAGEPWTREHLASEYEDFEYKLAAVCKIIRNADPECSFLAAETMGF